MGKDNIKTSKIN